MKILDAPPAPPPAKGPQGLLARLGSSLAEAGGWRRLAVSVGVYAASLAVFAAVVAVKGGSPLGVFRTMVQFSITQPGAFDQVLLRSVPIVLAALAVAIPARAGLVNVGGEGQLIVGSVAAVGVGLAVGGSVPGPFSLLAMALAGAAAGALWAGLAGVLRTRLNANEAVTTLLLNFVANDILLFLIYQPWKDPNGSGQPQSRHLAASAQLPHLFGGQLELGVVLMAAVAVLVWWLLKRTGWGFALRIVGGNREAGRRFGLPVERLLVSAMLAGGALAGLGGMLNIAGVELQLRPGTTAGFGYIAFLASFLGRHDPWKVALAALLFSAVNVSSNGLQLTSGLDGNVVNILMALIVVGPLVLAKGRKKALT